MKIPSLSLLLFSLAYLVILGATMLQLELPEWLRYYGGDFLCMPIVLSICALVAKKLKKDPELKLPLFSILSLTFFYSLYFEWYLPQDHPRYTTDPLDVLMYFFGALLFYALQFLQEGHKFSKAQT